VVYRDVVVVFQKRRLDAGVLYLNLGPGIVWIRPEMGSLESIGEVVKLLEAFATKKFRDASPNRVASPIYKNSTTPKLCT
jgi:hypothetical protein